MGVQRLQPAATVIRMAQLDHVAVAVGIPLGAAAIPVVRGFHRTVCRGIHRRADGGAEIQRPVQAAIIIKPPSGDHMALQRPAKQNIPIV